MIIIIIIIMIIKLDITADKNIIMSDVRLMK